jgi:hypothetical protein
MLHSLFIYISYFPFLCIYTAQLNLPWAVSDQIVCQILDCLPQNIVYSVTSCFRIVNSVTRCFRIVYSFTRCLRKEYLLGKNKMTEPQTSEHTMANLRQYQNYISKKNKIWSLDSHKPKYSLLKIVRAECMHQRCGHYIRYSLPICTLFYLKGTHFAWPRYDMIQYKHKWRGVLPQKCPDQSSYHFCPLLMGISTSREQIMLLIVGTTFTWQAFC